MLNLNHFGNGVNLENLYNTVQAILCQEETFIKFATSYDLCEPNHEILFDFPPFFQFGVFAIKIPEEYNNHLLYFVFTASLFKKKFFI